MNFEKLMRYKIKLNYVFEEYPQFYQPYINLLVDKLKKNKACSLSFTFFKTNKKRLNNDEYLIPAYFKRRLKQKYFSLINIAYKNLSYPEIYWLKNKFDIVHIQHSFLYKHTINILKVDRAKRPKVVITLRGADTYIKPWVMPRWKSFYKDYGGLVDAFITVSEHQKAYLVKWGVSPTRVHVIPISIGKPSKSIAKFVSKDGVLKIVSAHRMCWEKNIETNIRVVKNLIDKGYNVQYDIYGEGQDMGQVYFLIDKFHLENHVNPKGKIDNKKFKAILPYYDIYLQLSLSESAGATVIEAQSKGVPCVVSNSGGLPEMIVHEKTGFIVDYYDSDLATAKILEIYEDSSRYNEFSKNAIEFVNKNFTIHHEEKKLFQLYNKLVGNKIDLK